MIRSYPTTKVTEELIEACSNHKAKVDEYKAASVFLKGSQAEKKWKEKYFSIDSQYVDRLKTQLSNLIAWVAWEKEAAAKKAAYARTVEEVAAIMQLRRGLLRKLVIGILPS